MTRRRNWFTGCPECGAELFVKNAAVVRVGSICDNCHDFLNDDQIDPTDALVSTELGWCGCGSPGRVDEMMVAYLESRQRWHDSINPKSPLDPVPFEAALDVSADAELLLAYIADDLGWTEHGGSVGGSWLTHEGKEALSNLKAAGVLLEDQEHTQ